MKIMIPQQILDLGEVVFVCNVSGGKDSTATALALREAGIEHRRVFADTGWEAPETYAHLEHLRAKLGPIDVVGYPGGMPAKIRARAGFSTRVARWCTEELKIQPLRAYCDAIEVGGAVVVTATGIRAEEGTTKNGRAELAEVEDDERWGGWMWRPIHKWLIADVLAIHHRHGVEVNPLYLRGHNRVGCYPCVMASKEDVRLVAEHSPDRIDLIRSLETEATEERARRNAATPGRYGHPKATFFMKVTGRSDPNAGAVGIDEVAAWARTDRGGRQLPMFPPVPDGGCFRWGLCEAPQKGREP